MNWLIGNIPIQKSSLLDDFFKAIGKALMLSTNFEKKCQCLLRYAKIYHNSEDIQRDGLTEFLLTIKNKSLMLTIKEFDSLSKISDQEFEILSKAKNARNVIAHDIADIGFLPSVTSTEIINKLALLRKEVLFLASGDNLVSTWLYEIEMKESAPTEIQKNHIKFVDKWIFDSFDLDLTDIES
jgi:hypothetical protein